MYKSKGLCRGNDYFFIYFLPFLFSGFTKSAPSGIVEKSFRPAAHLCLSNAKSGNTLTQIQQIDQLANRCWSPHQPQGLRVTHLKNVIIYCFVQFAEFWMLSKRCSTCMFQELNMAYNRLESLPLVVSSLKGLETLDISHNKISNIPPRLSKIRIKASLLYMYFFPILA